MAFQQHITASSVSEASYLPAEPQGKERHANLSAFSTKLLKFGVKYSVKLPFKARNVFQNPTTLKTVPHPVRLTPYPLSPHAFRTRLRYLGEWLGGH